MRYLRPIHAFAPIALVIALVGCGEMLEPGEWGTFRYFGQLDGETPMRILPPITDRDGNVYVLHGKPSWMGSTVYVGHHLGGWSGGCEMHKGENPTEILHGFVGRAQDRAWWWSGLALGKVSGNTGMCQQIVGYDLVSEAELDVIAAVPWVEETPSRTTMLAMVRARSDAHPYIVVIDLDQDQYTSYVSYDPDGASDMVVVGTGASTQMRRGYVVMSYLRNEVRVSEVVVLDRDGEIVSTIPVDLGADVEAYSVRGFLQVSDSGLVAGLMDDGRLLMLTDNSGGLKSIDGFDPVGMLLWDGQLWVTGTQGGAPVVARLDDNGSLGSAKTFSAAQDANSNLGGTLEVLDERSDPSSDRTWSDVRSAISSHPLLSSHPLDVYTAGSTGWLVAGPSYTGPTEDMTSVAFAPVGVSVP
jgi:hypothetical protein